MNKLIIIFLLTIIFTFSSNTNAGVVLDVACSNAVSIKELSTQVAKLRKNDIGEIVLTMRGDCIHVFDLGNKKFAEERIKLEVLYEMGVQFFVDSEMLNSLGISKKQIVKYVIISDEIFVDIATLQSKHKYSYIYYAGGSRNISGKETDEKLDVKNKNIKFNW